VYVANSEPAKWVCGGGRAVVAERAPKSGQAPKHTEAGRDTRRLRALPREALLLWSLIVPRAP